MLRWGAEVYDGLNFVFVYEEISVGCCCGVGACAAKEETGFEELLVAGVVDVLTDVAEN